MITLTEKGAEKVREFLAAQGTDMDTAGLRVGVRGGGCSGFQYNLAFDQEKDGGAVPPRFERWRDLLTELRPRYLRLLVVWSQLQPRRGAPPDWAHPADGCLRGKPPCAPFAGIRDELRAARAAGLEVVVDILGAP